MRDFNHTIGVLVKAYLNDTLEHSYCHACAVGNLLKTSNWKAFFLTQDGVQIFANPGEMLGKSYSGWESYPMDDPHWGDSLDTLHRIYNEGMTAIQQSGYSLPELAKIEFAFETAPKGNSEDEWMFNGLMAVVDVLAEIHGIDLTTREETKKLFVKSPAL